MADTKSPSNPIAPASNSAPRTATSPPPHTPSNPPNPEKSELQKALEDQKKEDLKLDPRGAIEALTGANHDKALAEAHIVNLSTAKAVKIVDGKYVGPWDDLIEGSGCAPGDIGYMQLDELGVPTGLTSVMPPLDPPVSVMRVLIRGPNDKTAQITTPSGADLIPPLNPDPDFRPRFPEVGEGRTDPRISKHDERRAAGKVAEAKTAEAQSART